MTDENNNVTQATGHFTPAPWERAIDAFFENLWSVTDFCLKAFAVCWFGLLFLFFALLIGVPLAFIMLVSYHLIFG